MQYDKEKTANEKTAEFNFGKISGTSTTTQSLPTITGFWSVGWTLWFDPGFGVKK